MNRPTPSAPARVAVSVAPGIIVTASGLPGHLVEQIGSC